MPDVGHKTGSPLGLATGYRYAQMFTQPELGVLRSLSFWAAANTGVGISFYADSGGHPGAKIVSKYTEVVSGAPRWVTENMSVADQIDLATVDYHIVFEMQASGGVCYSGNGGKRYFYSPWTYGTAFPNPWSPIGSTDATYQALVYWTYDPLVNVSDSGVGTDSVAEILEEILVSDSAAGTEDVSPHAGDTVIDYLTLPHVQRIHVEDRSILGTKPVRGQLPLRDWQGKVGRQIQIEGWTRDLVELAEIVGFNNGEDHSLILPTDDSLTMHVLDVDYPRNCDRRGRYVYRISTDERKV